MVTLRDIAHRAGVSTSTVSRILNGVNKGVRTNATRQAQEVVRIARQMGYVFDQNRLNEVVGDGGRYVGMLVEGFGGGPWESEFFVGVQNALAESGYLLVIMTLDQLDDFEKLQQLYMGLECVISSTISAEARQKLEHLQVRVVWMDAAIRESYNCVCRDEYAAGEMAVAGMVEKGYPQLVLITGVQGGKKKGCFVERQAGAESVAKRSGVPLISMQIGRIGKHGCDNESFLRLLSASTGVVALDVGIAMWCLGFSMERGLIAGRDFGLVSCGEIQVVTRRFSQLTRISYDRFAIGRKAGEIALRNMQGQDVSSCRIPSEWVEGCTANSMNFV